MNRLKQLRNNLNATQANVASYLGVDRTTYTGYETGKREPDNATLIKLAEYFGVSVDYLLERPIDIKTEEATIEDEIPDKIFHMARKLRSLPEEQQDKILEMMKSNIDAAIKMLGFDVDNE